MKLTRKYVAVAAVIIAASFLLGTAVLAAPKNPHGRLPKPDYDSGWVDANYGIEDLTFTHNLGTRDLYVYIYYRMEDPTIPSPDYTATHNIRAHNVYWFAYDYNAIKIGFPETPDYVWQEIRVLIWAIPN